MAVPRGLPAISFSIVESDHILLPSNEMLYELARVLRYPRMLALHGLSEKRIYDYVGFLREAAETAVIGEADVLCSKDRDFFEPPAEAFLRKAGIAVLDDVSLMHRLR